MKNTKKNICKAIILISIAGISIYGYNKYATYTQQKQEEEQCKLELEEKKTEIKNIYNVDNQNEIKEELEEKKASKEYTIDNILVEHNPFGTNTQSLYVYFTTEEEVNVSYTVHVDDENINDFSGRLTKEGVYKKEHEYQIIGLIPNSKNIITLKMTDKNGNETLKNITYNMGSLLGNEKVQLEKEDFENTESISDGLYVFLGKDSKELDFMYYYDNDGVLRGEIPIIGYRSHRIIFNNNKMYYSISEKKMAEVDNLGQVTSVYSTGKYKLHHDYVFDNNGDILILATDTTKDTQEDIVVKLNTSSKKVEEVLDLGELLPSYKATCVLGKTVENSSEKMDWMHINCIQWMGNDSILLSSRETSTIIKVSDLYNNPKIEYMIGEESFWEGTDYENLLYTKLGDFPSQAGQHSIIYETSDELESGQYYIMMFNNNYGVSTSNPNYDWSQIEGVATSTKQNSKSYYYKYLVDENLKTYELVDSFEVPFSGYVSSVQKIDNNIIVDSGIYKYGSTAIFSEYDLDGNIICKYTINDIETMLYRVYKYDFNNFYFNVE